MVGVRNADLSWQLPLWCRQVRDQSRSRKVTRCTCSVCTKKGILLTRVKPEDFNITSGEDHIEVYQFNKMVAKHCFCSKCGIHTFGNPRTAPDMLIVNVNTLDDFDVHAERPEVRMFDGRN
ncbi:MAG: GFA family protein [Pseudomonadota bacterium]